MCDALLARVIDAPRRYCRTLLHVSAANFAFAAMLPETSRSPTSLPSASSLFSRSPNAVDSQRPLPRLLPLPPRSPTIAASDQSLLVFLHPNRSPTCVAVAETEQSKPNGKRPREDEHKSSSEEGGTPRARKRVNAGGTRCRKPTYLVRKEEKGELVEQIRKLEAQVHYLEQTAANNSDGLAHAVARRTDHKFFEQEMHNHLLREAVRNQHFQLFSAQSALSELTYSVQQQQCPINTYIRLGCDIEKRRLLLEGMKSQKLLDAEQLMDRRTQFMKGPDELRRETAQFNTDSGALCAVIFEVTPLDAFEDVKDAVHAFKAVNAYARRLGTAVVPSYAGDDPGIFHSRLQIDTRKKPTETSFVMFSEMHLPKAAPHVCSDVAHDKHNETLGVFVLDSVDEDDLHPYQPSEFLREDINAVITIARGCRRVRAKDGDRTKDKCEPCLVIRRWILLTLLPNDHGVATAEAMDYLLQTCLRMGDEMLQAVREGIKTSHSVGSHSDQRSWSSACYSSSSKCSGRRCSSTTEVTTPS